MRADNSYSAIENYTYETVEDPAAPAGIRRVFRWTVSDAERNDSCIAFYLVHHFVQVYLNGEPVYSIEPGDGARHSSSPGCNWVIIPVYPSDNGSEICVSAVPAYQSVEEHSIKFLYGSRSSIIMDRFWTDMPQLTLSALCILLGITLMLFQAYLLHKHSDTRNLFYLGCFSLLMGLWRITDTLFTPIILPESSIALNFITISSLFLMPVPLLLFAKENCSGKKRHALTVCSVITCLSAITAIILQLVGAVDVREILPLSHINIIINAVVVIFTAFPVKKRRENTTLTFFLVLGVGAVFDMYHFYSRGSSSGILFTVIAFLIYASLHFISAILRINRKAFTDAKTGLFNKSRWDELIRNSDPIKDPIAVIMFDLNRLKYTNDTMGHSTGDKLIYNFGHVYFK